jgi:GNAT superfamily N-acetyltransferase
MAVSKLSFRKATPADVQIILPLVRSAYRGDDSRAGWTTEADLVADERIDAAGVLVKINEPNGALLLAYDDAGSLVACCEVLGKPSSGVAYFGLFAVTPRLQGGGIGRQVLEEAERFAREAWGVSTMEMCVIWTREELIAWYGRRGYRRTGETRPFPYKELVNGVALRDDLHFEVLEKDLEGVKADA